MKSDLADKTVGIIGGMGEMGRLFTRFFKSFGFEVMVGDRVSGNNNRQVVETSDLVLFAVPLHETVSIIESLVPYTRSDQILLDLTSLKVGPVEAMLKSPSRVVGLHPMFGGRINFFTGQTIIACPVRIEHSEWIGLRSLFVERGMRVKECTPEHHDRMMSIIQVLFHVTTMLTGRVLRELDADIGETMDFTSPSYRLEINLLGRMFAQNGALYSAITQMNPYSKEILNLLDAGLEDYRKWYESKDLRAFVQDFEKSADYLGNFCQSAFEESSALLDFALQLPAQERYYGKPIPGTKSTVDSVGLHDGGEVSKGAGSGER